MSRTEVVAKSINVQLNKLYYSAAGENYLFYDHLIKASCASLTRGMYNASEDREGRT